MDDPGALGAETDQRLGDPLHPAAIEDADHLAADTRRIGERAEDVEDGADAELAARASDVPQRRLERGRVEKHEARRAEAGRERRDGKLEPDAERLEDVGPADRAGDRPVPVLGDGDAGAGDDEARGGRHVQGARAVAARAAGIHRLRGHVGKPDRVRPHGARRTDELVDRLALHAERDEERPDLRRGRVPAEDALHCRGHLGL